MEFAIGLICGAAIVGAVFMITNFEAPDELDAAEKVMRENLGDDYAKAKEAGKVAVARAAAKVSGGKS